jgi:hypothetical protein
MPGSSQFAAGQDVQIPVASLPLDPRGVASQMPGMSPAERADVYDAAETIGRVGDHVIFRGDLIGDANLVIGAFMSQMSEEQVRQNRARLDAEREKLIKTLLKQAIERKLMFLEFMRDVPAEKRAEVVANIDSKSADAMNEDLEETLDKIRKASPEEYVDIARQDSQLYRLAMVMKEQELISTIELDRYLRQHGTSLKKQQVAYIERKLGQQKMFQSIDFKPEITHDEMLQYYNNHQNEFQVKARVRWQQLSALFDRCESKEACGAAITAMGNEVVLGGAPFWAVAERGSHGPNAADGGEHGWTEWGDLTVSREILKAAFALPVQQMSHIIEDAEGLHIIRVLERQQAHVIPFVEAQVDIEKTLQAEKRAEAITEYIADLQEKTPVWTIYDDQQMTADTR